MIADLQERDPLHFQAGIYSVAKVWQNFSAFSFANVNVWCSSLSTGMSAHVNFPDRVLTVFPDFLLLRLLSESSLFSLLLYLRLAIFSVWLNSFLAFVNLSLFALVFIFLSFLNKRRFLVAAHVQWSSNHTLSPVSLTQAFQVCIYPLHQLCCWSHWCMHPGHTSSGSSGWKARDQSVDDARKHFIPQ